MKSDDLNDPKLRYEYLQNQFREQANRQIALTKERLDSKTNNSFAAIQCAAFNKTMSTLQQMGIYNNKHERISKTQKEADALFDVYYNAYLEREKTSPSYFKPNHVLGKFKL